MSSDREHPTRVRRSLPSSSPASGRGGSRRRAVRAQLVGRLCCRRRHDATAPTAHSRPLLQLTRGVTRGLTRDRQLHGGRCVVISVRVPRTELSDPCVSAPEQWVRCDRRRRRRAVRRGTRELDHRRTDVIWSQVSAVQLSAFNPTDCHSKGDCIT